MFDLWFIRRFSWYYVMLPKSRCVLVFGDKTQKVSPVFRLYIQIPPLNMSDLILYTNVETAILFKLFLPMCFQETILVRPIKAKSMWLVIFSLVINHAVIVMMLKLFFKTYFVFQDSRDIVMKRWVSIYPYLGKFY